MRMSGPMNAITNLLQSFCLAGLIFCTVQAPAVGAAELKAELVNKVTEDWGGMDFPTGQVQLTFPDGRILSLCHIAPICNLWWPTARSTSSSPRAGRSTALSSTIPPKARGNPFTRSLTIWTRISAPPASPPTAPGWPTIVPWVPAKSPVS